MSDPVVFVVTLIFAAFSLENLLSRFGLVGALVVMWHSGLFMYSVWLVYKSYKVGTFPFNTQLGRKIRSKIKSFTA